MMGTMTRVLGSVFPRLPRKAEGYRKAWHCLPRASYVASILRNLQNNIPQTLNEAPSTAETLD